ncbi:hypothetical protein SDJN03_00726, partial [Cucurbita argyrosperma subsp. sororia]
MTRTIANAVSFDSHFLLAICLAIRWQSVVAGILGEAAKSVAISVPNAKSKLKEKQISLKKIHRHSRCSISSNLRFH